MEEMQEVFNLGREQELIYETILSLYKAGWKQYIDCNNLSIKLAKSNKEIMINIDSHGNLSLSLHKGVTPDDVMEMEEVFNIIKNLTDDVNLFIYFNEYVESFKQFLRLEGLFNKYFIDAGGVIDFEQS